MSKVRANGLQFHDIRDGKIELKCRVGDGWQSVTRVDIVGYKEMWSEAESVLATVDCRLGAHESGAWWLILSGVDLASLGSYRDEIDNQMAGMGV